MLEKTDLRFSSTSNLEIHYSQYIPKNPIGVVVQIAHGMMEHKERYAWLCEELCSRGYDVFINDHRGHGKSINKSDIFLGEMGKNGFEQAVSDLEEFSRIIKKEFPNHKHVLLGHSMGSLLSRRLTQRGFKPDALILTGTPSPILMIQVGIVVVGLAKLLKIDYPWDMGKIFSSRSRVKRFGGGLKGSWLCKNERVVEAYMNDSLCRFNFTSNSFYNLLVGTRRCFSRFEKVPKDLKVLLVSGADDVAGEFSKGVIKAMERLQKQGVSNVSAKLFGGLRHEIFNEHSREEVLAEMLDWLERALKDKMNP
ncbi:alpha/beta fold hydrolase [Helicobacter cetorum]|uniref:alpha/beta fold hydrolase n=1 Tax=Helicobacter cetorum TaxID=138563 RepID=UPI000CF1661B|nr:alpha/beta hydrolase [Helicobacter cetorum]